MSGGRDWTKIEEETLLRWSQQGVKVSVCAKRLGRTWGATWQKVRVLQKRAGARGDSLKLFGSGQLSARVRKLCLPGVSDQEVAIILGVSRAAVAKARWRLGIPPGLPQGGKYGGRHPDSRNPLPVAPPGGNGLRGQAFKVAVVRYSAANRGFGTRDTEIGLRVGRSRGAVNMCRRALAIDTDFTSGAKPGAEECCDLPR